MVPEPPAAGLGELRPTGGAPGLSRWGGQNDAGSPAESLLPFDEEVVIALAHGMERFKIPFTTSNIQ